MKGQLNERKKTHDSVLVFFKNQMILIVLMLETQDTYELLLKLSFKLIYLVELYKKHERGTDWKWRQAIFYYL